MKEIQIYLGTNQNFDVGVQIYLKHKSEYADFFRKNQGAKKGSLAHNMLIQELNRLAYEMKVTEKSEEQKKKSLDQVISEVQKPKAVIKLPAQVREISQEKKKPEQKISQPKGKNRKTKK